MKTDVEELSPTRVKLIIEVPFDELRPSLDRAYREVAKQVRVPGFRPGRVPPRIIDQRFGRGAVLEQAVNEAVPQLYGKALEDNDVYALGQPQLEITELDDGKQLAFTAEVDRRPRFEVPDVDGMAVTVEDAVVTPDEVEEYLGGLRERFASLKTVDHPAEEGDYVSIDLSASVDGEEVDDAQASGLSYRIGDDSLVDGLDAALAGMTAGASATFTTELSGGDHAGQEAEVTVTAHSVKVKEFPELDDEFAQSASEFDTIGELRAGTRAQLERVKRLQQAGQARDGVIEALLGKLDVPLPEAVVTEEVERRNRSLDDQLERIGASRDAYLESAGKSADELAAEIERDAIRTIKANFVLDQFALQEKLGVDDAELTSFVVQQAQRMGVSPDQLATHLRDSGQIGSAVSDVLRAKALDLIVRRAAVKDSSGNEVDLAALSEDAEADQVEAEEALAEETAAGQADAEEAGAGRADAEEADAGRADAEETGAGQAAAEETDAGRAAAEEADAGRADAGRADAGRADAGQADAGRADAEEADAGRADAGQADAGRADAGQAAAEEADAGRADAEEADAGRADAGQAAAAEADAGRADAGRVDAGRPTPRDADVSPGAAGAADAGAQS